jgi:cytochrome P450
MGRSTKLWGPTAKEFDPSRWLDDSGNLKRESPFRNPVFNAGPRTCLGQNMAVAESVMVLCALFDAFDFELVEGQEVTYDVAITLRMKNPLFFKVSSRQA